MEWLQANSVLFTMRIIIVALAQEKSLYNIISPYNVGEMIAYFLTKLPK